MFCHYTLQPKNVLTNVAFWLACERTPAHSLTKSDSKKGTKVLKHWRLVDIFDKVLSAGAESERVSPPRHEVWRHTRRKTPHIFDWIPFCHVAVWIIILQYSIWMQNYEDATERTESKNQTSVILCKQKCKLESCTIPITLPSRKFTFVPFPLRYVKFGTVFLFQAPYLS